MIKARLVAFIQANRLPLITCAAFAYFAYLSAPDITYINRSTDSIDYLSGAKWLRITHPTGAPLYNIGNHLWLQIPHPGTDYWWLTILTSLAGAGLAHLAYRISGRVLAPLLVMAGGVAVSQAPAVNTSVPSGFLVVPAWYPHVKDHPPPK